VLADGAPGEQFVGGARVLARVGVVVGEQRFDGAGDLALDLAGAAGVGQRGVVRGCAVP
jgi:hypothetical protein